MLYAVKSHVYMLYGVWPVMHACCMASDACMWSYTGVWERRRMGGGLGGYCVGIEGELLCMRGEGGVMTHTVTI